MENKRKGLRLQYEFESDFDIDLVEKYIKYLINWIKKYVSEVKAKGTIVGLSGGIDSAIVAILCKKAFPKNSLCLWMPINDNQMDKNDIDKLVQDFDLNLETINLKNIFSSFKEILNIKNNLAVANLQPRLRMSALYAKAQENNYLVIGTDNEDEYYVGYFTKYGDGGVDLLPIVHLLKSEVKAIAQYLSIPQSIIDKKPSAGLTSNQNDEDELGFSYKDLDNFLIGNYDKIEKSIINRINSLHQKTKHKRNIPIQPMSIEEFKNSKNEGV